MKVKDFDAPFVDHDLNMPHLDRNEVRRRDNKAVFERQKSGKIVFQSNDCDAAADDPYA